MARELITKEVGGTSYKIGMFGTTESLRVLTQLSKIVGPSLGMALGADSAMAMDKQNLVFGEAVKALVERLEEDKVITLVKKLVGQALKVDGGQIIFETEFQGRLGHLFKLLKAILEVQYGDFLEQIKGLDASRVGMDHQPQKTASTGGSGA